MKNKLPASSVKEHLQKQFLEMEQGQTSQQQLGYEVFDTLDTIHFFSEIVELFTVRLVEVNLSMLDGKQNQAKKG